MAPTYPSQVVRFGQDPKLPDDLSKGRQAYEEKYTAGLKHGAVWRMRVGLACVMLIFTVISVILGIAGITLSAEAINVDTASDEEIQAAKIILDAYVGWT